MNGPLFVFWLSALLTCAGYITWLFIYQNWRDWFSFAERQAEEYVAMMRERHLPLTVSQNAWLLRSWFHEVMGKADFQSESHSLWTDYFYGGKGYIFRHPTRCEVRIYTRERHGQMPSGEIFPVGWTEILIQRVLSNGGIAEHRYSAINDPLNPSYGSAARRGRLVKQRYRLFRFILEDILQMEPEPVQLIHETPPFSIPPP